MRRGPINNHSLGTSCGKLCDMPGSEAKAVGGCQGSQQKVWNSSVLGQMKGKLNFVMQFEDVELPVDRAGGETINFSGTRTKHRIVISHAGMHFSTAHEL